VWLDNLARSMIRDGGLYHRIRDDGLSGITSNPQTFKDAIAGSDAYDDQIRAEARYHEDLKRLYEALAVKDVQDAADLLRWVYDDTNGTDGFVSLEVSPRLASDTEGTINEARRLWNRVARDNVLIKIPGTPKGVPAIEACLIEGVNVNVTLLFSLKAYRDVAEAFLRAMETRQRRGATTMVSSVASFFLSRIDVKIDEMLETAQGDSTGTVDPPKGRAATACAKLAYQTWKELFSGERWTRLESAGARPQKLLWASTSTKNPAYSDVKYIEPLIGPDTISTMPERTLDAFRDHGQVDDTLERHLEGANRVMRILSQSFGIDIDRVAGELLEEGIGKFRKPFDALQAALEVKRRAIA
jgi:transaldolase